MDENFVHQKCAKVLRSQNSQLWEDQSSFLMVLLSPIIYLHNKSLA